MKRYILDCMATVKTDPDHAAQLADVLLEADYRGHYSHGLNRLAMYINDIRSGMCAASGKPKILKDKAATAWVDGNNLLGPVVGNFCMSTAIKKAKEAGVGWVVAKGSNHYGIAGWYSMTAQKQGLLGLSFTNTSPLVYPTRAGKVCLGTNPLTLAAPAKGNDSFVLDMATTTVAVGKIELADRKGEQIHRGWGADGQGKETTNPKEVLSHGGLLPLGGTEISGGYKGYGLGALVEIVCGILADGAWGPGVRKWLTADRPANLGQCFAAIDPEAFAPDFRGRLQSLLDTLRKLPLAEHETNKVMVAGDPEREHMKLCDNAGGIPYHANQIAFAEKLAKDLGVKAPAKKGKL